MIRVGICDDEQVFRDVLRNLTENYMEELNIEHQIEEYESGIEVLESEEQINILLLDIEMDEISGIDLKDMLQRYPDIRILFVSSHTEDMSLAFGKNVYGFLEKPVEEERFRKYMGRMVEDSEEKECVLIKTVNGDVVVEIEEIMYCKAAKKYSYVRLAENEIFCELSIMQLEEELKWKYFYRCHRSYLVNLRNIHRVSEDVEMVNGEKIPVVRNKRRELREKRKDYIRKKAR